MPIQRVFTALEMDDYRRLRKKAEEQGISDYTMSKNLITDGLKPNKRTPLTDYSTKELLKEIWRRIP